MTTQSISRHPALPWIILAAGLAIRLAIAPLGAHPGDFATLTGWADALRDHSVVNIYQVSDANYPPLSMTILYLAGQIASVINPEGLSGPVWMILLKTPIILADIGIAWILWELNLRRRRENPWWLATVVFNPALIYLSAWWGQFESIAMLGALGAVLAASDRRFVAAGIWLGLGVMVKLQAAVVVPVVVLMAIMLAQTNHQRVIQPLKVIGAMLILISLCLLPYAWTGQLELVLLRLIALVAAPGWLTVNALNFWYVITGGSGNWKFNAPLLTPDNTPVLPGLSAHDAGLFLLATWVTTSLAMLTLGLRKTHENALPAALWAAALLFVGVFLWPTQSHERYAFGAVVMAAGMIPLGRKSVWMFGVVSLLHLLNLVWAAPFSDPLLAGFSGSTLWGMVIALAWVVAAGWMLVTYRPASIT